MQQHDLVPEYNAENSAVRKYFKMIGAIAFVDLIFVDLIFVDCNL